ncbi:CHAP domain-containing protein [Streptomyces sp. NPDC053493]|uniref:CHAP domain-containing protein n=1 Tax=Streptomyces sp. NPDC053493 TaxID=3365705 RepID=UPI0037D13E02
MAFSRTQFVNLLRAQVGYHEGRDPSGNWNNQQKFSPNVPGLEWSQGQAWCATFTAWGADELGARDRWPITASCYTAVQWWKKAGRWTEYPVLGGPFYLGTSGQDHVGVVYAYDDDTIYTVEGNTNAGGSFQGDGVYLRSRPRRGPGSPYGYGVPQFDEDTISADPALGGTRSASVAAQTSTTRPPVKETTVALTDAEIKKLAKAAADEVWSRRFNSPTAPAGTDPTRRAATFLVWGDQHAADLLAAIEALSAKVAALESRLNT